MRSSLPSNLQVMLKLAAGIGRLPFPEVPHGEEGLIETLWLLLTSVIAVPLVCKLPGGSPVLGFLVSHCLFAGGRQGIYLAAHSCFALSTQEFLQRNPSQFCGVS